MPRNRELMRIFRDLDLVEQLGSGVHRILKVYTSDIFHISDNFLEARFDFVDTIAEVPPTATPTAAPTVTPTVKKLIEACSDQMTRAELQRKLKLKDKMHFIERYLKPAIQQGMIELTIPDKPKSPKQKYRLTEKGKKLNQVSTSTKET